MHGYQVYKPATLILQYLPQAARRNLVYPNYAWIVYAWYPEKWWTEGDDLDGCTNDFLEDFLIRARALLLNIVAEPDDFDAITDGGFVSLLILYIALFLSMYYNI